VTIAGLDVSSVQGLIQPDDWERIRDRGTRFVCIKCGNGNDGRDPDFEWNVEQAQKAGLLITPYHFPYGLDFSLDSTRDPRAQAQQHFEECGGFGSVRGTLPACLDFEWPRPEQWGKPIPHVPNSVVDRTGLLLRLVAYRDEYVRLQGGRRVLVYGDPWFLKSLRPPGEIRCWPADVSEEWMRWGSLASSPLWLAAYGRELPAVSPWSGAALVQTSGGGGRLPGGEPVDTDECLDENVWASLLAL